MRIVAAGGADITITSPLQAAGADALTNSTSGIPTYDLLSGFNGSTWDRLRALGDDADGISSASLGRLLALARLSGYNGATWDRLLSEGNDRDAVANTTLGNLQTLGFPHGYNGASWDRLTSEGNDRDAISVATLGLLQTLGFGHIFNGATWDRQRALGTTTLLGLGQAAVSLAIPGASTVKGTAYPTTDPGTTRQTVITPTSGKKIRMLSIFTTCISTTDMHTEWYFGEGANIMTTPPNAIAQLNSQQAEGQGDHVVWGDGAGPVGAADAVLSLRGVTDMGADGRVVVVYREE